MKLKRELTPDLPEGRELPEEKDALIDGWVEQIERNNKSAEIRLDRQTTALLNLRDVTPNPGASPVQNMKEILAPYDRIRVTIKKGTRAIEVAYSMENEVRVGDVNWSIITGDGGFYNPEPVMVQGGKERCEKCDQLLKIPKYTLKKDLFTVLAKKVADVSRERDLRTNQLRNFYDVVKATQDKLTQAHTLEHRENLFSCEKPRLKLLYSKVVYAKRRGNIPSVFAEFVNKCLDNVIDKCAEYKDFEAFALTFEAVAGYFGSKD